MSRAVRSSRPHLRYTASFLLLVLLSVTASLAIDDNLTKGATNNHVFEQGVWGESIDTLSGALNLTIPIGPEYRVSGDLSFQLNLAYNNKFWHLDDLDNDGTWQDRHRPRLSGRGQAGLGFMLQMGRKYQHMNRARCDGATTDEETIFEDSTGAAHPYDFASGVPALADGSYMWASWSRINMPDGTRYLMNHLVYDLRKEDAVPDAQDPLWHECLPDYAGEEPWETDIDTNEYRGLYVTRIEGRNRRADGSAFNHAEIEYETAPGMRHLMKRITPYRNGVADTARAVVFENSKEDPRNPANSLAMGYVKRITLPVFSSDPSIVRTATYTFDYTAADVWDAFAVSSGFNPAFTPFDNTENRYEDMLLLTRITFPEGYTMEFGYTGTEFQGKNVGFVQARTLPTGARIEYDYRLYDLFAWDSVNLFSYPVGATDELHEKRVVLPQASGPLRCTAGATTETRAASSPGRTRGRSW